MSEYMVGLSEYEVARKRTIEANEAKLFELGLLRAGRASQLGTKKVKKAKARPVGDPDYMPEKRTTRVSGLKRGRPAVVDESTQRSREERNRGERAAAHAERVASVAEERVAALDAPKPADDEPTPTRCIIVEGAKTGRSKCRRCMEAISAGETRVGMESWMVGRQVLVWQHPKCFWQGLAFTEEGSGRGRCKQTKEVFAVGEHRLSASAHTTSANFKLNVAAELLRPVASALGACTVSAISGASVLSAAELKAFEAGVASPAPDAQAVVPEVTPTPTASEALELERDRKQPAEGAVARASGRVAWRWAGALCYGHLLPKSETATHCYARTAKGNTKTLTKGGVYWWML